MCGLRGEMRWAGQHGNCNPRFSDYVLKSVVFQIEIQEDQSDVDKNIYRMDFIWKQHSRNLPGELKTTVEN